MQPSAIGAGVDLRTHPSATVSQGTNSDARALRFFVGAFLASSIAICLTEGLTPAMQIARWILLACASALSVGHLIRTRVSLQMVAWLLSGIYAMGTLLYTIDIPTTTLRSLAFFSLTLGAFAGGFLCYRSSSSPGHRLPNRIALLLVMLAVPSLAGFLLGYPAAFFFRNGEFRGLFCHPNTLGAFGALWLVIGVAAFDGRLSRHRYLPAVGTIAMALCLLPSRSRAGMGGAAIGILLYWVLTRRLGRIAFAASSIASLLAMTYIVAPHTVSDTQSEVRRIVFKGYEEDVFASRRGPWEIGMENFLASPLLGHGFGTSVGMEVHEWRFVNLSAREKGNSYLAILEETGVLGAIVMGLPILLHLLGGFRVKRLNSHLASVPGVLRGDARLAAAFWAAAVAGLANNYAEATLWSAGSPFGGMLLFFAGASEGLTARTEERL